MSYVENRVRVSEYGSLPSSSPLLVPVPTATWKTPQRLHVLAARDFRLMSAAALSDLGIALLVASGWRRRRWASRQAYEAELLRRYKKPGMTDSQALARGRRYLAYASPHETGLALDLGCGDLAPVSATVERQRATPLHEWLVARAWEWGFTPYRPEPWHWERRLPLPAYLAGEIPG